MSSVFKNQVPHFYPFPRIIIFHESPNTFYFDTHHKRSLYFNFSGKVFSLPLLHSNPCIWRTLYRTVSCPEDRKTLPWGVTESSSHVGAQGSCPGPPEVSLTQTPISISGQGKKHVVSCHQWHTHSQADSPICKPTVKNNTLAEWHFLMFDKVISKLKWKRA